MMILTSLYSLFFSFPQALERFLSSIKTSSDPLLSGMSHCWADLCRGTLLGAVLDQVVWPVLHRVMERFLSPPTIPDRPQVLHQYKLLATNFSDDLECLELSWVLPFQLCSSPPCLKCWWAVPPLPCHSGTYPSTSAP